MKLSLIYKLIIFIFILFVSLFSYQYICSKRTIPQKVLYHNETDINVDKLRFIFKTQSLSQRALSCYSYSLVYKDEEELDKAIEYYEAALGFLNINFTKEDSINSFVKPKIEKIINLIEKYRFKDNITDEIVNLNEKIVFFLEGKEKVSWENIHSKYVDFTTKEYSNIYLYQFLVSIIILTLILLIAMFIIQINLHKKQKEQDILLLNQSRLASIGEMLSNIAHQWRQPLSVITTNVSLLQAEIDLGEKITHEGIKDCANSVVNQATFLSKTIDDFRDFFSKDTKTKEVSDIKDIFKKLNSIIGSSFKNNSIKFTTNIPDNTQINLNTNLLIQALLNISNNAKDAILTNNEDLTKRYFDIDIQKDKNNLIISLQDSGGGIDDNIINKIFEPYFTTKHKSVGTGIGLYMTYQIITKKLEGSIEVQNNKFTKNGAQLKGAEFTISIPIYKK